MQNFQTTVQKITELTEHPNADKLEVAQIQGWYTCVRKGQYKKGDKVIYFQPETVIPKAVATELGISAYLSSKLDIHGNKLLVVKAVKLRGVLSFGLILPCNLSDLEVGSDCSALYGTYKYEPPVKTNSGDSESDSHLFPKYHSIQNLRSKPEYFYKKQEVVVLEKIHGTNCCVGFIKEVCKQEIELRASSRRIARKAPDNPSDYKHNTYWYPHSLRSIQNLIASYKEKVSTSLVVYGEVYGGSIQKGYSYGINSPHFRVFDIRVDNVFLDHEELVAVCNEYDIDMCPTVYRGLYSLKAIKEATKGESLVGGLQGKEGVVVKPIINIYDKHKERYIAKYHSDKFLYGTEGISEQTDY